MWLWIYLIGSCDGGHGAYYLLSGGWVGAMDSNFGQDVGKEWGGETFVMKGLKLWNQKKKLNFHVEGINNAHNQAVKKSEDLMKEK